VGTQGGLVRYDGYSAKVYQFGIEDPLRVTVEFVYETPEGELWIGTIYEELYQYNRATDAFLHYKNNPKDSINVGTYSGITSIHDDRNGNLWMIMSDFESGGKNVKLFDTKTHQFKQFGMLEKGNRYINASVYTNSFEDSKDVRGSEPTMVFTNTHLPAINLSSFRINRSHETKKISPPGRRCLQSQLSG
jgi:hypothetical protein